MQPRSIMLALALLVALVVGMFTYTYLARQQVVPVTVTDTPTTTAPSVAPYGITRIEATHFYQNGVHTIVGELALPTPCDLLTSESRVAESMPEQVTFAFSVINNSDMCTQVVTTQRFKVSATASDQARLSATLNGVPVELNLIEAAAGATPDDFEVYTKG